MEFIFEASIRISSELQFKVSHRNKKWELPKGNSHFLCLFDTIDVNSVEWDRVIGVLSIDALIY